MITRGILLPTIIGMICFFMVLVMGAVFNGSPAWIFTAGFVSSLVASLTSVKFSRKGSNND